ncbi:MAG: Holliday junction resolvase RuvX [Chloroflexi bacterium]|nr:Holliday junction resolvase RuvX [Chloroflexota bacterium]
MRILGVDLGSRRVGIAISDETQTLATPHSIIIRKSFSQMAEQIKQIAIHNSVGRLVAGYPRSLSGEEGPQAQHAAREAQRLADSLELPLVLWDEQFSTALATQLVNEGRGSASDGANLKGHRPRRREPRTTRRDIKQRGGIDAFAAAVILQSYLDAQRAQGSPYTTLTLAGDLGQGLFDACADNLGVVVTPKDAIDDV